MQFRILGPLDVLAEQDVVEIKGRMQRRLLAVLLVHARTVVSADRLIDILWAGEPPAEARQGLWTCVARLRHVLAAPTGTAAGALLITRPPGYLLAAPPDQIDAGQFESLISAASRLADDEPHTAAEQLDRALALWRGSALEEFADETFAAAEATRLDELRCSATEDRFEIDLVLGAQATLIGPLGGFAAQHPLRERPRAQLMRALYRCGRQAEALETFNTYRKLLDRELGLEPSVALCTLQTQILRQSTELDWSTPARQRPAESPVSVTGFRLPAQMTSFVGRDEDLAAAAQAVTEARLVTLTGVGGVGKTRLALRTAAATAARFADGLCWCELAPVTDPDAVAPAVATALGVHRGPAATVVESVVTFLGDQQRLLILDNCEHLLGGVRPLVSELLRGCPRLVVLATSRAKLGINGERVRPVAPLPLPSASPPRRDEPSPAVRLFVERARAVRPDLRLDQATRDEIGTICRHLDGLPLALELAAARMRSLNPADISDRMRSDLDLLSSGDEQSDRHGSLRAVLDWSYGLLTTEQRQLFDRLSVFAGSFDLAAAEEVCAGRGIERSRVVDLLTSLVDASMVAVGGTEGAIRYSLLETLRRYGAEHCGDSREADLTQHAHARHFAALADQADLGLRGPEEARWVAVADRDLDNLRAAHRWMLRAGQVDLALRLARGLRYYMLYRFRDEVVAWGEASLDLSGAERHPLFAEVSGAVGEGLTARGEMAAALSLAIGVLNQLDDPDDVRRMYPLRVAGMVALYVGRLDDGYREHAEMLRLARLHDRPYEAGMALLGLAQSRTYAGEPDRGLFYADEQLRVVQPLGNPSMLALAWYDRAEALSSIDAARAIEPYQRAIQLAESAGSTFVEGIALVGLASLLGSSSEPGVALPLFRSIISRWRRMGIWHHQWTTLRNLVQLFIRIGSAEPAAVLIGAINAGSTATPAFGSDADLMAAAAERLRVVLGRSRWSEAYDRGAALSGDEALALACGSIDAAIAARAAVPG